MLRRSVRVPCVQIADSVQLGSVCLRQIAGLFSPPE
jgi:hypothetical protein